MGTKIATIMVILLAAMAWTAEAADSKVIRVSITIPAIVGVNTEEPVAVSTLKPKIITANSITQVEKKEDRNAVVKTILIK